MRCLVIDDSPADSLFAARAASKAGFTVASVSSLGAARAWLATYSADLILCDLNTGDSSGPETVQGVAALTDAKIVVVTGQAVADVHPYLSAGATLMVNKNSPAYMLASVLQSEANSLAEEQAALKAAARRWRKRTRRFGEQHGPPPAAGDHGNE